MARPANAGTSTTGRDVGHAHGVGAATSRAPSATDHETPAASLAALEAALAALPPPAARRADVANSLEMRLASVRDDLRAAVGPVTAAADGDGARGDGGRGDGGGGVAVDAASAARRAVAQAEVAIAAAVQLRALAALTERFWRVTGRATALTVDIAAAQARFTDAMAAASQLAEGTDAFDSLDTANALASRIAECDASCDALEPLIAAAQDRAMDAVKACRPARNRLAIALVPVRKHTDRVGDVVPGVRDIAALVRAMVATCDGMGTRIAALPTSPDSATSADAETAVALKREAEESAAVAKAWAADIDRLVAQAHDAARDGAASAEGEAASLRARVTAAAGSCTTTPSASRVVAGATSAVAAAEAATQELARGGTAGAEAPEPDVLAFVARETRCRAALTAAETAVREAEDSLARAAARQARRRLLAVASVVGGVIAVTLTWWLRHGRAGAGDSDGGSDGVTEL